MSNIAHYRLPNYRPTEIQKIQIVGLYISMNLSMRPTSIAFIFGLAPAVYGRNMIKAAVVINFIQLGTAFTPGVYHAVQ